MHLLLTFENGMREQELIATAKKNGIKVYGLSDYIVGKQEEADATVLLGYANLSEEKIKEACEVLCEIWKK